MYAAGKGHALQLQGRIKSYGQALLYTNTAHEESL